MTIKITGIANVVAINNIGPKELRAKAVYSLKLFRMTSGYVRRHFLMTATRVLILGKKSLRILYVSFSGEML